MTTTTAAVLRQTGGPLSLEAVALGTLGEDEVLVRVAGVGVCHTDLSALEGLIPRQLPSVLGHEGAGTVEAVGAAVTELAVGDRVVLSFDHCRSCRACRDGTPGYCTTFSQRNHLAERWFGQSSWATHAIATEANAIRVATDAPLALLGPLGCSLLTGAGAVLRTLRPSAGDGIAVFGLGSVGLAAVMAAAALGCSPIVAVDRQPARIALALELGATFGVDVGEVEKPARHIRRETGGGVRFSVEAVGAAPVVRQALEVLTTPGRCASTGFAGARNEVLIDQGHLLFGRHLLGVVEGDANPHQLIPELLALHADGHFPFERLVTTFPLTEVEAAIAAMRRGDVIKPVLLPDPDASTP